MFKKYPKIHRLGKEETDFILNGTCVIQEKIDGANVSIWLGEDGTLQCGTRTRHLTDPTESFNGFREYVNAHEGMKTFFEHNPTLRLCGEWLVKHTIAYDETKMRKFYLFDITTRTEGIKCESCHGNGWVEGGQHPVTSEQETLDCPNCEKGTYYPPEPYFDQDFVQKIAFQYEMEYPQVFGVFENPTEEDLKQFVGKSALGQNGEGIVIKNYAHKDKWGNHCHAKMITEAFLEDNGVAFGGNNKHSDTYWEMYITNKYMTLSRIQKQMNKLQPEIDRRLSEIEIPRIASMAYHDMLTEEIWEISKKVQMVNFQTLKRVATKKAIQIYKDVLNDTVNVNDQNG